MVQRKPSRRLDVSERLKKQLVKGSGGGGHPGRGDSMSKGELQTTTRHLVSWRIQQEAGNGMVGGMVLEISKDRFSGLGQP